MKPKKFSGSNFIRWSVILGLWLTAMNMSWIVKVLLIVED
jgi:hypothetical protein